SLLEKEVSIDIEMVDERLTTAQAERVLLGADVSRKKRKAYIDKIAAQLILQAYLDSECTKE
ncbi:MAG: Holliday junction resolvase RuvX, partial [Candidatus Omnitrophica bacterium]|nr:Holliday junction resolvase RuvX [Candidatus Omnitrophota bacterium]